jgi:hypothetical protein
MASSRIMVSPDSRTSRSFSSRPSPSVWAPPTAFSQAGFTISMRPSRSLAKIRSGVLVVIAFSSALRSRRAALARSSAAVLLTTLSSSSV